MDSAILPEPSYGVYCTRGSSPLAAPAGGPLPPSTPLWTVRLGRSAATSWLPTQGPLPVAIRPLEDRSGRRVVTLPQSSAVPRCLRFLVLFPFALETSLPVSPEEEPRGVPSCCLLLALHRGCSHLSGLHHSCRLRTRRYLHRLAGRRTEVTEVTFRLCCSDAVEPTHTQQWGGTPWLWALASSAGRPPGESARPGHPPQGSRQPAPPAAGIPAAHDSWTHRSTQHRCTG